MRNALLQPFASLVEEKQLGVHAAAVMQHGAFLGEYRVVPDEPHILHSLTKSYTSVAVGMLIGEGRLALDDRIASFFPELLPAHPSRELLALSVRDLLRMAPGRDQPSMMANQRGLIEDKNWVRYYLSKPFDRMPGERFSYDTGCTYILSAVVQQVSGETTLDFLTPRLFEPLGIEKPYWETCPMGRSLGGAGLFLRTKELLPFGQLCLQHGIYNGKRLVSADYLAQATSKQIDTQPDAPKDSRCGYGYQFWMCHNGTYRADGAYAQFLIVDEENDAVIAVNSKSDRGQEILDAVWETVTPLLAERR